VSWYSEVFDIVFAGLDREKAANLWHAQLSTDKEGHEKSDSDD
jgi:Lon-like ATP-dependent protease